MTQISLPGVALAVIGAIILLWRYPAQFLFQALLIVLLLLFTLDFEVVNLDEAPTWYLMPAYFILTVWLGLESMASPVWPDMLTNLPEEQLALLKNHPPRTAHPVSNQTTTFPQRPLPPHRLYCN